MASHTYQNLIFTTHALARMKERSISSDSVFRVVQNPDIRKGAPDTGKPVKFIKQLNTRKYHIVAEWKKSEQKWLVISVWVRGENDRESLSMQLVLLPFRLLWWIITTIFSLFTRKY